MRSNLSTRHFHISKIQDEEIGEDLDPNKIREVLEFVKESIIEGVKGNIIMKKFIYLFICVLIYSCKAQVIELDIKKQDIIVLNFTNGKIKLIVRNNIYSKDNLIVTSWIWAPEDMGKYYFEKNITFIQNKDTMNINYYGQGENLYLKSLQFKKGNYKLSFKKPTEKIIGSKIKNLKGVQNFLFKNAYVSPKKPVFQNVYFKNIEFHGVDLKDTINVKLVRIELLEKK